MKETRVRERVEREGRGIEKTGEREILYYGTRNIALEKLAIQIHRSFAGKIYQYSCADSSQIIWKIKLDSFFI